MKIDPSLAGGLATLLGAILAVAGLAGIDGLLVAGLILAIAGLATFFFAMASSSSKATNSGDRA